MLKPGIPIAIYQVIAGRMPRRGCPAGDRSCGERGPRARLCAESAAFDPAGCRLRSFAGRAWVHSKSPSGPQVDGELLAERRLAPTGSQERECAALSLCCLLGCSRPERLGLGRTTQQRRSTQTVCSPAASTVFSRLFSSPERETGAGVVDRRPSPRCKGPERRTARDPQPSHTCARLPPICTRSAAQLRPAGSSRPDQLHALHARFMTAAFA